MQKKSSCGPLLPLRIKVPWRLEYFVFIWFFNFFYLFLCEVFICVSMHWLLTWCMQASRGGERLTLLWPEHFALRNGLTFYVKDLFGAFEGPVLFDKPWKVIIYFADIFYIVDTIHMMSTIFKNTDALTLLSICHP